LLFITGVIISGGFLNNVSNVGTLFHILYANLYLFSVIVYDDQLPFYYLHSSSHNVEHF